MLILIWSRLCRIGRGRIKAQTLQIIGANLYYEMRGSGPTLLLIAGGNGDAGIFERVASVLANEYTVVTYDPRGNSRSRFFSREVRQFTRYVPDLPALEANQDRIVLAGGRDSREHLPYRPAALLAERFGTQVVDFPGDHIGYVTQPVEFAAKLQHVLA